MSNNAIRKESTMKDESFTMPTGPQEESENQNVTPIKKGSDQLDQPDVENDGVSLETNSSAENEGSNSESTNDDKDASEIDQSDIPEVVNDKPESKKRFSRKKEKDDAKPSAKKSSPSKRSALRAIRNIFIAGVIMIGGGTGYLFANQNGYIAQFKNLFSSSDEISELDRNQNESIAKMQLKLSDVTTSLNTEVSSLKDQLAKEKESREAEIINARVSLEQLLKEKVNAQLTNLSGRLDVLQENLNGLSQNVGDIKSSTTRNATELETNTRILERAQSQISQLKTQIREAKSENEKALKKALSSPKESSTTNQRIKQGLPSNTSNNGSSNTSSSQRSNIISSYSGLSYVNNFPWATQKVAVLSDGLGMTVQVYKGYVLGNSVVTDVTDEYVFIKDSMTNQEFALAKIGG